MEIINGIAFKEIPTHPDFFVSDTGIVRANETITIRSNGHSLRKSPRVIKTSLTKTGYVFVRLSRNGIDLPQRVHRLVAITFISNPNNYTEVNHINGVKTDNRVVNLEWCSRSHNIKHAFSTGLRSHSGEKNNRAKVTESDVIDIRLRANNGESISDINSRYKMINRSSIKNIILKKTWCNVDCWDTSVESLR